MRHQRQALATIGLVWLLVGAFAVQNLIRHPIDEGLYCGDDTKWCYYRDRTYLDWPQFGWTVGAATTVAIVCGLIAVVWLRSERAS
jgi:hypothetical protein